MSEQQIAAARARADDARGRLGDALSALRERLLPRSIARNLAHGLAEQGQDAARAGVDAVKKRPGVAVGLAALAGLFLARKPIARALGSDPPEIPDATPTARPRSPARTAPRRPKGKTRP